MFEKCQHVSVRLGGQEGLGQIHLIFFFQNDFEIYFHNVNEHFTIYLKDRNQTKLMA